MTVHELMTFLRDCPPMNEVYIQTSNTGLNNVEKVSKDESLGIVELKWEKK